MSGRDQKTGILLILPSLCFFFIFMVYPLICCVVFSFFSRHLYFPQTTFVGLNNYLEILRDSDFFSSLLNSIIFAGSTVVLQIVLGVVVALVLNQSFKGAAIGRGLVLFPYLIPTIVAALVWRWMFNDLYGIFTYGALSLGIIDKPISLLASTRYAMLLVILIDTWKMFPFVVICVLGRLQTISPTLYEAAEIDGAGVLAKFWHITLTQLKSVILMIIILRTIWNFNNFDLIYLLTGGGPLAKTQTLPIFAYSKVFDEKQIGLGGVVAILMILILIGLVTLYTKLFRFRIEEEI